MNPAAGVYVNSPAELNDSVPCRTPVTSEAVSESPSGSESLYKTPLVVEVAERVCP